MVLQYAKCGDFNDWIYYNYKDFNWKCKIIVLNEISNGLKIIHQKQMVHRDFHTGNILFNNHIEYSSSILKNITTLISDMGSCGNVDNIDKTNIYGVMPYVAPEVLRGKPYTQAADIYSFGMIMYFVATGRQPFSNCAHDECLALDICNGRKPEINEQEVPKCYIDLMNKCLDLNPNNRPDINEIDKLISSFIKLYKNYSNYMKI
ncbi:kinase-like domain-containing protein [Glomus cerebriforme]|uniref:Kinase-like domain-containing protein n=1 Tax=Glomus cerebriforme TaxID=658196 RepID=A0A397SP99_9GLOM|nr:kinase-like domain-containing protein [Glomus cerebriforme]